MRVLRRANRYETAIGETTTDRSIYDTADDLELLPTPREIELTGDQYELDDW